MPTRSISARGLFPLDPQVAAKGQFGLLRRPVLSWLRPEYGAYPTQEVVKSLPKVVKIASRPTPGARSRLGEALDQANCGSRRCHKVLSTGGLMKKRAMIDT